MSFLRDLKNVLTTGSRHPSGGRRLWRQRGGAVGRRR